MSSFYNNYYKNMLIEEINYLRSTIDNCQCPYLRKWYDDMLLLNLTRMTDIVYMESNEGNKYNYMTQRETVLTKDELKKYNGTNGMPAYVAVDGVVYDVSRSLAWGGASHYGLMAGEDLSSEYVGCHSQMNVLWKLPRVGVVR